MKIYANSIEFFCTKNKEYGGHSHWIAKIFNYRLRYLMIGFCKFKIGKWKDYYDGYHNAIFLGFIQISYGTWK